MVLFKAYFADGLNIGKVSVLAELAEPLGLDRRKADEILSQGTFKDEVDRDWEYSRVCGITAVPTFLVRGRVAVGAQPYDVLSELVRAAGAKVQRQSHRS